MSVKIDPDTEEYWDAKIEALEAAQKEREAIMQFDGGLGEEAAYRAADRLYWPRIRFCECRIRRLWAIGRGRTPEDCEAIKPDPYL
ncbi:hypothetical protein Alvin_3226 (plasmid) [Allochromatium vinosum DSM 180]|uniref:Uncharacterized protein n=2 Tax=Allochromatium vinosum TaxID=1049 RepID=D3RWA6_ALLVD|nr:hypothetical protein Alvin_3226 [Allochromatium vinosum DSM 180]